MEFDDEDDVITVTRNVWHTHHRRLVIVLPNRRKDMAIQCKDTTRFKFLVWPPDETGPELTSRSPDSTFGELVQEFPMKGNGILVGFLQDERLSDGRRGDRLTIEMK
jgi:hypothetical protein